MVSFRTCPTLGLRHDHLTELLNSSVHTFGQDFLIALKAPSEQSWTQDMRKILLITYKNMFRLIPMGSVKSNISRTRSSNLISES